MASSGAVILLESLRSQGVEYLFGIVGIPIVEVAYSAQAAGVKYIGMRSQQAVSMSVARPSARQYMTRVYNNY